MVKVILRFRSKTKEFLKTLSVEQKSSLMAYMQNFVYFDEGTAWKELVKIKISPEKIIEENASLKAAGVTVDTLSKIYGDLVENYKCLYPNCWLNKGIQEYPSCLCNAVANDKSILLFIKRTVKRRLNSFAPLNISRLDFLLNSKEEKNRFGGLRELGFSDKEAQFLKKNTVGILEYVKAMIAENIVAKTTSEESEESEKKEESMPKISEKADSTPEISEKTSDPATDLPQLSAAKVIARIELFEKFVSAYNAVKEASDKLEDAGFEMKAIFRNIANIRKLVEAAESF